MSVHTRVNNDEYKTKLPYPDRVKEPAVLRKTVKELTPDEYASIPTVTVEFEAAKVAERAARDAYNADNVRLMTQFRADLEDEYGMVGHPKADALWSKAWENGHSSGLSDVVNIYDDLVDLVK